MNSGIKIILYPVADMLQAKEMFRKFLEVDPDVDQPYYVGFHVGGQDIGLVPANPEGGAAAYYNVDNIKDSLQILLDGGAEIIQDVKNVGGNRLIASVKYQQGNIIGLVEN